MNEMKNILIMRVAVAAWLVCAGCATPPESVGPVVAKDEVLTFLDGGIRPEVLLFPEYLLMEDFELSQHGRIPGTTLIGADMKSDVGLGETRRRYTDLLASMGWKTDRVEIGKQSFRMLLSKKREGEVEIRAVQGSGATQVFLLYTPALEPAAPTN